MGILRCSVCNRVTLKPAVTITRRSGTSVYGPVCAARAGLTETQARLRVASAAKPRRQRRHRRDVRQLDLLDGITPSE